MAGEWVNCTLGQLCDLRAGAVFKPELQGKTTGDYPFIKVSDMNLPANAVRIQTSNNWVSAGDLSVLKAKPFPPGTVVFAKIGEALRQNRLRQIVRETVIDNNMMGAVPNRSRVYPTFLYYALSQFDFAKIAQGTALPYLTVASLSALALGVPPDDEQRAIAHILGTLDDKIDLNRRMNETLEAIARAIFKSWFIDFDPVRAKASGEPPESICRRLGLTPDLLALFPDRLVDSRLGEIPEGWEWSSIGEEVSVRGGATPSTSNEEYWLNGEFAWVTPKDLAGASAAVLTRSERRITAAAVQKIASGQLPRGTVLLTSRAPIGYVALAMIAVSINQGFIAMVCDKRLPNTYVLHWTFENIAAIKQRAGGTTFAEISKGNFRPMPILVPETRVLQSFNQFVIPLYEKVTSGVQESDALGETRDSLLPRLLSGELRVPLEGAE
jgi:type I restriction enzyme S subunit